MFRNKCLPRISHILIIIIVNKLLAMVSIMKIKFKNTFYDLFKFSVYHQFKNISVQVFFLFIAGLIFYSECISKKNIGSGVLVPFIMALISYIFVWLVQLIQVYSEKIDGLIGEALPFSPSKYANRANKLCKAAGICGETGPVGLNDISWGNGKNECLKYEEKISKYLDSKNIKHGFSASL